MPLTKRDISRIESFLRPKILETVNRINREQSREEFAGRGAPEAHAESHAQYAEDEVLVSRITKRVTNDTASTIPIHSVVAIVGVGIDGESDDEGDGENQPSVAPADHTDAGKLPPFGLTLEALDPLGGSGLALLLGDERGVDTVTLGGGTWLPGDELYLDPTTPGTMTRTLPDWPVYRVATVIANEDVIADDDQDGILFVSLEDVSLLNGKFPPNIPASLKYEAGEVLFSAFASSGAPARQRAAVAFFHTYTDPVVTLAWDRSTGVDFAIDDDLGPTGFTLVSKSNQPITSGSVYWHAMEKGASA